MKSILTYLLDKILFLSNFTQEFPREKSLVSTPLKSVNVFDVI